MAFWRRLGLSDGAALVVALLIGILGGSGFMVSRYETQVPVAVVQETAVAVVTSPLVDSPPEVEPVQSASAPDIAPLPPEPQAPNDPVVLPTSLDVVRVSPEGDALIAGIAAPGEKVIFLLNGIEQASAQADEAGNFVGFFDVPVSRVPSSIGVGRVADDGSVVADNTILIAPVDPEKLAAVVGGKEDDTKLGAQDEPVPEIAQAPASPEVEEQQLTEGIAQSVPSDAPEIPVEAQDVVESLIAPTVDMAGPSPIPPAKDASISKPQAPTIVVASAQGVEVLQPAAQPRVPNNVSTANVVIDTISYDDLGEVALEGRGRSGGFVRVYLNEKPILTSPIEADGSWATPLVDVDAGVYTLRIDEITEDGRVTSRVETPFQREEVEIAADAPPTAVTVQTGSTLWAIAAERFGEGTEYVRVYEENRDLIRDPNLIYPGQVFALPQE